ncbi:MAG TPA: dTDP-4-dehydrorhamnose 3,5-epimerase family protein [Novosphingobium sp.]|nr:dTDP-4-dehydrorhamnose 3,5-epimerase family protein [Novosphingobium sp.]
MITRFFEHPTQLDGALVIERRPIGDARGFVERLWCDEDLATIAAGRTIRQINRTVTRTKGTVRGMHFQRAPHAETKFVHCLRGRVFDVAVDLRRGSATFGKWHGVELAGDAHLTFVIPEGFAHGFQALTDDCGMLYFHTAAYAPEHEGGVHPMDPQLAIGWPLPVGEVSARDRSHPMLDDTFEAL